MFPRTLAAAAALFAIALPLPSPAQQYQIIGYVAPRIAALAQPSTPPAGAGTVVIQVRVESDGSHQVIKIIKSTNHTVDGAARDAAQRSKYTPAMNAGKPVPAFIDVAFRVTASGVEVIQDTKGVDEQVTALLRNGRYAAAKAQAAAALSQTPSDAKLRQLLGVSEYYLNDYQAAVEAFSHVSTIAGDYRTIASESFANVANKLISTDTQQAVALALKATEYNADNADALYTLGAAQLAAKSYTDAVATLQKTRTLVSGGKSSEKVRANIDTELMVAQIGAGDMTGAQTTLAEIKKLDPSSTTAQRAMGRKLLEIGNAAGANGDVAAALSAYNQAAALSVTDIAIVADLNAGNTLAKGLKPDFAQIKAYADKALAINASDANANYLEGYAITGQWAAKPNDELKNQAMSYLNKAKSLAQGAGNADLASQIDTFVKNSFGAAKATPQPAAHSSPSGGSYSGGSGYGGGGG